MDCVGSKISNIGLHLETMHKCIDITKRLANGDQFYFSNYRTDGINLTNEDWAKYVREIPEYFQTNGKYEPLTVYVQNKKKTRNFGSYITAGYLPVSNETYEMLPKIFHYYLETIYFCPKIGWRTFVESFSNYMEHGAKDYVLNGFTDFLFSYGDSGDFSISFNENIYDYNMVYKDIKNILSE